MVLGLLVLVGWIARFPLFDNVLAHVLPKPLHVPSDCWFLWDGKRQIQCGYLYIYEDRDLKSGMVRLPVVVVKSTAPDRRDDPVLMIQGGPGGAVFGPRPTIGFFLSEWLEILPWASNRDVIFYDQRGAGWSRPSLKCPEYWQAEDQLWDAAGIESAIIACRDRLLAEGIDLTAYNTTSSADDIEDLRRSLDVDHWNLFATSYGTRLALAVMRQYPEGVRSAILASVDAPENYKPDSAAPDDGVLELIVELLEACASSPECATHHPNVRDKFFSNLRVLQIRPVTLDVGTPFGRARRDFKINDATYIYLLDLAFLKGDADDILLLTEEFSRQSYWRWIDLIEKMLPAYKGKFFTKGMFWSVNCNDNSVREEGNPSFDKDRVLEFRGYYHWMSRFTACGYWPHQANRRLDTSSVQSEIPTLLLAGGSDRTTPPRWARKRAASLSNGYLFELPGRGHDVTADPCANPLIAAFLDDPTKRPRPSCAEALSNAN